jgi:FkbM family methyltransferase
MSLAKSNKTSGDAQPKLAAGQIEPVSPSPEPILTGSQAPTIQYHLSEEEVRTAFRFAFHTEPRPVDLDWHRRHASFEVMRKTFLSTAKFFVLNNIHSVPVAQDYAVQLPDGHSVWIANDDLYVGPDIAQNKWEPAETAFMQSCLKPGQVMLDIGAMLGWFTLKAAKAVGPAGAVIAFEPQQRMADLLNRSVLANRLEHMVTVHRIALSNQAGEVSLLQEAKQPGQSGSNIGHTWIIPAKADQSDEGATSAAAYANSAPCIALDDMRLPRKIDFIKIDIEGAEMLALKGAEATIRASHPTIMCELFPEQLEKVSGASAKDLIEMMRSWSYGVYALDAEGKARPWADADMPLAGSATAYTTIIFK